MTRISVTSKSAHIADPELLTFDTEFWQQRIGRAYTADVNKWAADNLIGTVCLLIPTDEPERAQDAEERGFRFMDVRVKLERKTGPYGSSARAYRPEDLNILVRIARESHRITRFYADPHFPDDRCDDLYEAWIKNSVDGWAQKILVAARPDPVGYCTIHISGDEGSIGLIAVDEHARGHGYGADLVLGAVDWCHSQGVPQIIVVTQGQNIAAQRVFQRCGFITASTEIWMHRHYD